MSLLGKTQYYAVGGKIAQWIFTDIAVYERNSQLRWVIGVHLLSPDVRRQIEFLVDTVEIDSVDSDELYADTRFWIRGTSYDPQFFQGPWTKIEGSFVKLRPSFTVDVRYNALGSGTKAIYGTLLCGENFVFQSASGDYCLNAPPVTGEMISYARKRALRLSTKLENLQISGILYIHDNRPHFFYATEE